MIKLKFLPEDSLMAVKTNAKQAYKELIVGNQTIETFVNKPLFESSVDYEQFELDMSKDEPADTDTENVQRVYGHLKHLTDSQAADERIWSVLALSDFKEYVKYRYTINDETSFSNHCLFNYSSQRSLFRNAISRLWWIGRMTYNESKEDPYELTKLMCSNQNIIEAICGRNMFNNPNVCIPTLEAMVECNKNGITITKTIVEDVTKYINMLGSTYMLDLMDKTVLFEKVKTKIEEFNDM